MPLYVTMSTSNTYRETESCFGPTWVSGFLENDVPDLLGLEPVCTEVADLSWPELPD